MVSMVMLGSCYQLTGDQQAKASAELLASFSIPPVVYRA